MDTRLDALTRWVRQQPGFEAAVLSPVSGDASFRRYFRAQAEDRCAIAMDAPPEHEDCEPFVAIARHWRSHQVAVPRIHADNLQQGFLLLEDFGDRLLLETLQAGSGQAHAGPLYQRAFDGLCRIQQVPPDPARPLPAYDLALLNREMDLFPDWLLERELAMDLSVGERSLLETTFAFLTESALAQPDVPVHRDYHARNLLVRDGHDALGVIDFQDAVSGPVTYDLVSLLKDAYIAWPEQDIARWVEDYRRLSLNAGLHRADAETFRQWFELMGMQRHLKVAGIFARLALRDGKQSYLADIPRVVDYLVFAAGRQPALRNFHAWLLEKLVPRLEALAP